MNIETILNQAIAKDTEERKSRESSGKFVPSLFGCCFRRQYWKRSKEPESNPIDERTWRVFKCGSLFHSFVGELVLSEYAEAKTEVRIETEDVLGYADIVISEIDERVIELKSMHSRGFWYLARQKDEKEEDFLARVKRDKLPHFLQCAWYGLQLKKECSIIYISKDDLCMLQFDFSHKEFEKNLEDELMFLNLHWKNGLPKAKPRAYINAKTGKSKECDYCAWQDLCKNIENIKT